MLLMKGQSEYRAEEVCKQQQVLSVQLFHVLKPSRLSFRLNSCAKSSPTHSTIPILPESFKRNPP